MNHDEEIWLPLKGFEGYYEASSFGRIKTVNRSRAHTNVRSDLKIFSRSAVVPTQDTRSDGYLTVKLYRNNKSYVILVHKLIAKTFIPNPYHHLAIKHIDGNVKNNFVVNLKWVANQPKVKVPKTLKKQEPTNADVMSAVAEPVEPAEEIKPVDEIKPVETKTDVKIDTKTAEPTELSATEDKKPVASTEVKTCVYCVEDDLAFKSYAAAGRYYEIDGSTVSESIKNDKVTRIGKTFKRVPETEVTKWA